MSGCAPHPEIGGSGLHRTAGPATGWPSDRASFAGSAPGDSSRSASVRARPSVLERAEAVGPMRPAPRPAVRRAVASGSAGGRIRGREPGRRPRRRTNQGRIDAPVPAGPLPDDRQMPYHRLDRDHVREVEPLVSRRAGVPRLGVVVPADHHADHPPATDVEHSRPAEAGPDRLRGGGGEQLNPLAARPARSADGPRREAPSSRCGGKPYICTARPESAAAGTAVRRTGPAAGGPASAAQHRLGRPPTAAASRPRLPARSPVGSRTRRPGRPRRSPPDARPRRSHERRSTPTRCPLGLRRRGSSRRSCHGCVRAMCPDARCR